MKYGVAGFLIALAWNQPTADACSLVEFADNGAYVGGDLVEQIARKAQTIQIVKATSRHVVTRTFRDGADYLTTGKIGLRPDAPEYIDKFVYELTVVETLKSPSIKMPASLYDDHLRVQAYGATEMRGAPDAAATPANTIPVSLLERPGMDNYIFQPDGSAYADLGPGTCSSPYIMDVGDEFLAFRNEMGRLYPVDLAFPLSIDVEFRTQTGERETFAMSMQALVPLQGDSPMLAALRAALSKEDK